MENQKNEDRSPAEKHEPCPYCQKRMCGMFTGSTSCEPDGYRESYSPEEAALLKKEWDFDVPKEKIHDN